jgi:TonB family protein
MRLGLAFASSLFLIVAGMPMSSLPAAAQTAPAKNERDVWALVQRVGTADAYLTYFNRFRNGPHFDEARVAYLKLIGIAGRAHPPPAPPVRVFVPAPPPRSALANKAPDLCIKLLVDQQIGTHPSEEARSVLAAQRTNRVADYQTYLTRFPLGSCRDMAAEKIRARADRRFLTRPVRGLGPLAPQRIRDLALGPDDYSVQALSNGEQGRVVLEWDVSEDGVVELCRPVQPSGSESLDSDTCRLIVSRLRYDPARDSSGVAIRSRDHATINWVLPEEPPPSAPATAQ